MVDPGDGVPGESAPGTDLVESDRLLIFHLWRQNWTISQIAVRTGMSTQAVVTVLHEPTPVTSSRVRRSADDQHNRRRVRLAERAQKLQIWLPATDLGLPTSVLLQAIRDEARLFHLEVVLTEAELKERMRLWVYNTWLTVLEATAPEAPIPPQFELLVPREGDPGRAPRSFVPVRAGDVLVRLTGGSPGLAGRSLLGVSIPPPVLPQPSLPRGANTVVSANGRELCAAVDGQAIVRDEGIDVREQTVHSGDRTGKHGVLRSPIGAIVTGSLLAEGEVRAVGDVHIAGMVQSSKLSSSKGGVVVAGTVVGSAHQHAVLRAAEDIGCGGISHAELQAARDITVYGRCHYSKVGAGRDLYLQERLDQSLVDVELSVGGCVFVPLEAFPSPAPFPAERRHSRIPTALAAQLALYEQPPMRFVSMQIMDLSPGGARCRFSEGFAPEMEAGVAVELKTQLPDKAGEVVIIGSVARVTPPDELGVAFTQITDRDAKRITQYCADEVRARKGFHPGSREMRRSAP